LPDFLQIAETNAHEAAILKLLIDTERQIAGVAGAAGSPQPEVRRNRTQLAAEIAQTRSPSWQSTSADGVAPINLEHGSCSSHNRGFREGRASACDALKEIDLFEHEPPRGNRTTMLYKAIDKGSVNAVAFLLDLGAGLSQLSPKIDGEDPVYLPLSFAAMRGHEAIVKLLIEKGADIHARDHFGNNSLLSAALGERDKVIELLLNAPYNAGIEVQRTGEGDHRGFTPLMMAVYFDHTASIELLTKRGSRCDTINDAGDFPLHIAAAVGRLPTIKFLLQNGSQAITINQKTGDTALHCAVRNKSLSVATFLIQEAGLLLDVENRTNRLPWLLLWN